MYIDHRVLSLANLSLFISSVILGLYTTRYICIRYTLCYQRQRRNDYRSGRSLLRVLGEHCVVWPGVEESHHQVGVRDLWREGNDLLQRGREREHILILKENVCLYILSCTKLTPSLSAIPAH